MRPDSFPRDDSIISFPFNCMRIFFSSLFIPTHSLLSLVCVLPVNFLFTWSWVRFHRWLSPLLPITWTGYIYHSSVVVYRMMLSPYLIVYVKCSKSHTSPSHQTYTKLTPNSQAHIDTIGLFIVRQSENRDKSLKKKTTGKSLWLRGAGANGEPSRLDVVAAMRKPPTTREKVPSWRANGKSRQCGEWAEKARVCVRSGNNLVYLLLANLVTVSRNGFNATFLAFV